jgi:hypothetical protein
VTNRRCASNSHVAFDANHDEDNAGDNLKREPRGATALNLGWLNEVPPEVEQSLSPLEKLVLGILREFAEEKSLEE